MESVVHEARHNSTGHDHSHQGYDYNTTGLQSNRNGEVYPTQKNTESIINNRDKSTGF